MHPPSQGVSFDPNGSPELSDTQDKNYGQSKAANLFVSAEFARRYATDGIVSVFFNPGSLKSELQRHVTDCDYFWWTRSSCILLSLMHIPSCMLVGVGDLAEELLSILALGRQELIWRKLLILKRRRVEASIRSTRSGLRKKRASTCDKRSDESYTPIRNGTSIRQIGLHFTVSCNFHTQPAKRGISPFSTKVD